MKRIHHVINTLIISGLIEYNNKGKLQQSQKQHFDKNITKRIQKQKKIEEKIQLKKMQLKKKKKLLKSI